MLTICFLFYAFVESAQPGQPDQVCPQGYKPVWAVFSITIDSFWSLRCLEVLQSTENFIWISPEFEKLCEISYALPGICSAGPNISTPEPFSGRREDDAVHSSRGFQILSSFVRPGQHAVLCWLWLRGWLQTYMRMRLPPVNRPQDC
jgi:hypothetical protein